MGQSIIRQSLAEKYNLSDPKKVCCYYCKNWGYNNGKVINSKCESRCLKNKKWLTWASQFCRNFQPLK